MLASYFVAKALTQRDSLEGAAKSSQGVMGKLCLHAVLVTEKLPFEGRGRLMSIDRVRHIHVPAKCADPTFSSTVGN